MYVLLVVEFSVITLTHCLSKLLEALRYYVLLFLGSVRFACCGVLGHHTDTLPGEALGRIEIQPYVSSEIVYVLFIVENSVITPTHCLAKLSTHRDTFCFFPGKLCTCCGVLDRHTDTLSGEAVDASGYDPLLFPRKLSTF